MRDLVRARDDVRKDLAAARHRLGKFLLRHGRTFHHGKNWTLKFWTWVGGQKFERMCERLTFEHYVTEVKHALTTGSTGATRGSSARARSPSSR